VQAVVGFDPLKTNYNEAIHIRINCISGPVNIGATSLEK
jgi:hypothetical protein